MLRSLLLRRPILTATLLGVFFGGSYGHYRNQAAAAALRERWGYVCATGMQEMLVLCVVAGGLLGAVTALGILSARRLRSK
jgi:hypothetical protein